MLLADLGAQVIKIEDPSSGGDVGRLVPHFVRGSDILFFVALNRNKSSMTIDLDSDAGARLFRALAAQSDAIYSNLRGDVPARLGLTYDQLKDVNPALVCCSLSAFGQDSSMAKEPGYDYVLQGLAGWMSMTGEPDGPPTKSGLSLVDFSSGMAAALALVAGIHAARRDGQGMDCDVALYDVALSMLNYIGTWHLTAGYEPRRTSQSSHPTLIPFQNFQTADGWIVLGCAKEKFWRRLCGVLERMDLSDDPRFADFAARAENQAELIKILSKAVRTDTTDNWLTRLRAVGVPCAPILTVPEALAHPMARERKMIASYPHPAWGMVHAIASPIKVGSHDVPRRPAPGRGAQNESTLRSVLRYQLGQIEAAKINGAFGEG
jgi:crotonobetainyl-CoA:carnitine CoA-transferase CaiB-like acyl-CoA transferase